MTPDKWEQICRRNGVVPVTKTVTPLCEVFIAEGRKPAVPEFPHTHYHVVFAFKRNGMDVAKHMRLRAMDFLDPKARLAETMKEVNAEIGRQAEVGRYTR